MPSNSGQGGLALLHTVDDWGTKFGLYATEFTRVPATAA